jgi:hypothetical protein
MVPVTVLALLASCLVAPSFAGAAPPPVGPTVPAERSVPVTAVAGKTPPAPATDSLAPWSAGSPVWPGGGTGTVTVDTTTVGAAAKPSVSRSGEAKSEPETLTRGRARSHFPDEFERAGA